MEDQQLQESKFYQTAAMAIVIGVVTLVFVLFGLEKTGKYDGTEEAKAATKNSETLEVRGPFTKYITLAYTLCEHVYNPIAPCG
jgi:hypothetical protein